MVWIMALVFFTIVFGIAIYLNRMLDKREERRNKKQL